METRPGTRLRRGRDEARRWPTETRQARAGRGRDPDERQSVKRARLAGSRLRAGCGWGGDDFDASLLHMLQVSETESHALDLARFHPAPCFCSVPLRRFARPTVGSAKAEAVVVRAVHTALHMYATKAVNSSLISHYITSSLKPYPVASINSFDGFHTSQQTQSSASCSVLCTNMSSFGLWIWCRKKSDETERSRVGLSSQSIYNA